VTKKIEESKLKLSEFINYYRFFYC